MTSLILAAWLAAATAGHSITVRWSYSPNAVQGYGFVISRGPAPTGPFHDVAFVASIAARSWVDSTVAARPTEYCYQVATYGARGDSAPSVVLPASCAVVP